MSILFTTFLHHSHISRSLFLGRTIPPTHRRGPPACHGRQQRDIQTRDYNHNPRCGRIRQLSTKSTQEKPELLARFRGDMRFGLPSCPRARAYFGRFVMEAFSFGTTLIDCCVYRATNNCARLARRRFRLGGLSVRSGGYGPTASDWRHGTGLFLVTWGHLNSADSEFLLPQIFGRRTSMLVSLAMFVLGSALCGSAQNMNWLIAARSKGFCHRVCCSYLLIQTLPALQGAGGGGLLAITNIIVSDLVPLRERALYSSLMGV